MRRNRVTLTCKTCNSDFEVPVCRKDKAKYCSKKCMANGRESVICKTCGKEFSAYKSNQRRYCSVDCYPRGLNSTHGESRTRLYQIWCDMKNRCYCQSGPGYAYYGERGIAVCEEWKFNYVAFRNWANANGYSSDLELDRRDTNGNYCPENCRWATRVQQMRNTRKRKNAKTSKYKGVSKHISGKWVVQLHSSGKTTSYGLFVSEIEAAKKYDEVALLLYGEFAHLNFKEGA